MGKRARGALPKPLRVRAGRRLPHPRLAIQLVRRAGYRLRPMTRAFDPDAAAPAQSGIFGLPFPPSEALVHVLGVPFDATASYRKGAARGPEAILRASRQVDLFDLLTGRPYEAGICMLEIDERIRAANEEASPLADRVLAVGGEIAGDSALAADLGRVNALSSRVNELVHDATAAILDAQKIPAIVGGDHSAPFGAIRAAAERHPGLGLLHFDAHADLRVAFEGFEWSHASILFNALDRLPSVWGAVQVGVRDLGRREHERILSSRGRIRTLFDTDWSAAAFEAGGQLELVRRWIGLLPEKVWITFDVDGLDPTLCPSTGTPVPGGLSWGEAMLWLRELARSGRRVIGLDLCEVSPGEAPADVDSWDAIVGARLLYRLIGTALQTR